MSSQKIFILINCRILSKMFQENVWKEANTLVKVAFCSSGITFQGHNKILSEIMKICLFFFSQFQWVFLFFVKEARQGCQNWILGVPLIFSKKILVRDVVGTYSFSKLRLKVYDIGPKTIQSRCQDFFLRVYRFCLRKKDNV